MDTCNAVRIEYSFDVHVSIVLPFCNKSHRLVVDLYSGVALKGNHPNNGLIGLKKGEREKSNRQFICVFFCTIRNCNFRDLRNPVVLYEGIQTIYNI